MPLRSSPILVFSIYSTNSAVKASTAKATFGSAAIPSRLEKSLPDKLSLQIIMVVHVRLVHYWLACLGCTYSLDSAQSLKWLPRSRLELPSWFPAVQTSPPRVILSSTEEYAEHPFCLAFLVGTLGRSGSIRRGRMPVPRDRDGIAGDKRNKQFTPSVAQSAKVRSFEGDMTKFLLADGAQKSFAAVVDTFACFR